MDANARDRVVRYRAEMVVGLRSAYSSMDRSVLTLSSGALGLSMAFLRESSNIQAWSAKALLIPSWLGFVLAIVSTVISFRISVLDHKSQLKWAERTLEMGKSARKVAEGYYRKRVEFLNILSLICFILAICMTVLFVGVNTYLRYASTEACQ